MVDDVVSANVYQRQGSDIKVEIVVGVGFLKIRTFVHHVLDQAAGTLTWTLDESQSSDLIANTGYWMVRDGASLGGGSVVYYSCAVQLRSWAPGWLDRYIAREGLPRAVGWIKREAEGRAATAAATEPMHRRSFSSPNLADAALLESRLSFGTGNPRQNPPQQPSQSSQQQQQQQQQQQNASGVGAPQHRRSGSVTNGSRTSQRRLVSTDSWRE